MWVRQLGRVPNSTLKLDVLEEAGLALSLQKTVAMATVRGRAHTMLQSQFILRNAQGCFLKIPGKKNKVAMIRLVGTCEYLGIRLSYGSPEQVTLQRRPGWPSGSGEKAVGPHGTR